MDLMHHISQILLQGKLHLAPVVDPLDIFDVGTGTGIWAIDIADEFPAANVVAIDLSPIQPLWIPPNLQFEVADCEEPWSFCQNFDFIHMRNLSGAIADWPTLLKSAFEHLRPGGWLECSDIEIRAQSRNNSLTTAHAIHQWQASLGIAADMAGRKLNMGPRVCQLMKQAGFEEICHEEHEVSLTCPSSRR